MKYLLSGIDKHCYDCICFKQIFMWNVFLELSLILSISVLLLFRVHSGYVVKQIDNYPVRLIRSGSSMTDYAYEHGPVNPESDVYIKKNPQASNSTDHLFSIIIVTFNEPLLYKT